MFEDLIYSPNTINQFSAWMLATAVVLVMCSRLKSLVYVYALQSLVLAVIALCASYSLHAHHLAWMSYLTFFLKVMVIPWILLRLIEGLTIKTEVEPYVGYVASPLIACGLIILAYYVEERSFRMEMGYLTSRCLSVSLAILLIGFFIMMTRKKAITQIVGLLVMENGLFLGAIVLTSGMPMVVELGISFDILVGILIMGVFVFRIRETFASIDTSKLNSLRG
jgi:hydrogenase-4 component E